MMMHKDKTGTDFNEMKQFMRPTEVKDGQDIIHSGAGQLEMLSCNCPIVYSLVAVNHIVNAKAHKLFLAVFFK